MPHFLSIKHTPGCEIVRCVMGMRNDYSRRPGREEGGRRLGLMMHDTCCAPSRVHRGGGLIFK